MSFIGKSSRRGFVTAALGAAPVACLAARTKSGAREAIARLNRHFEAAHVQGDAAALARQYTTDGQALWGPDRPVVGRPAIERLWKLDIGSGGRTASLETYEVQELGKWAYETGRFLVHDAAKVLINDSNYLIVWRQVGQEWLIHRDIGSENRVRK